MQMYADIITKNKINVNEKSSNAKILVRILAIL